MITVKFEYRIILKTVLILIQEKSSVSYVNSHEKRRVLSYFSYAKYVDLCATINPYTIKDLKEHYVSSQIMQ